MNTLNVRLEVAHVGDIVEVYGLADPATGVVIATRVERKPPFVSGAAFVLVGTISNLTSTPTTCTFRISAATVNCAGAALLNVPASGLANGMRVKVETKPVALSGLLSPGPVVVASSIRVLSGLSVSHGDRLELEGIISNFVSVSNFQVNSQKVDASQANFKNGTSADLANGKRVEVKGRIANGVLIASKVEFDDDRIAHQSELKGLITDFVSVTSFKVRGQLVDASAASFHNGTAADLANGRKVEVYGPIVGNVLKATRVEFSESSDQDGTRISVEGLITDFVSPSSFKVNGQKVSTSASTVFEGGTAANLANGRKVEVKGAIVGGILIATKLAFEDANDEAVGVELEGVISDFVSPTSFKMNGISITTNAQTVYENGSQAKLANGVRVEIKGKLTAGILTATRIEFEESSVHDESKVEGYITNFVSVSTSMFKARHAGVYRLTCHPEVAD